MLVSDVPAGFALKLQRTAQLPAVGRIVVLWTEVSQSQKGSLSNSSCIRANAKCIACIPLALITEDERGILTIEQPRIFIIFAQACVAAFNTEHTIAL